METLGEAPITAIIDVQRCRFSQRWRVARSDLHSCHCFQNFVIRLFSTWRHSSRPTNNKIQQLWNNLETIRQLSINKKEMVN